MSVAFTDAELEMLLGRPVCRLLTAADRRAFAGRRVLITGAGGSVGSELARQIAACAPDRLTILDHSEFNLFQIERELAECAPAVPIDPVLADVTRPEVVRRACRSARPHVVYHAAAYKHVSMVERAVCAAAAVNILGTANALTAARGVGARFVLISSDKAASPQSVMGATKRLAELVVTAHATASFRPIVVRFGNVMASSGSVLPIMRDHIRRGLPIPVTDPNASRYFMTAGEAVSLVMKADVLATRAETYWLDMGQPMLIGDLADRLMTLEEQNGFPRVPVEIVGLKPGEKLREELTTQGLRMCRTRHPRIWVARQAPVAARSMGRVLSRLERLVDSGDALRVLQTIAAEVPEFSGSTDAWLAASRQSAGAVGSEPRARSRTA